MYIAPELVFVELQKTGGTHILSILRTLLKGRSVSKHNTPPPSVIDGPIPIMGSIRNPWDWYVSLWAYGCLSAGEIALRMRKQAVWKAIDLTTPVAGQSDELREVLGRAGIERAADYYYADANNVEAFREWIKVLLAPQCRTLVEPAYAKSAIANVAGVMTYRYFKLFVRDGDHLQADEVSSLSDLQRIDRERCFINAMLRNERLVPDFLDALAAFGVDVSAEKRDEMLNKGKTNASVRPRTTAEYYDAESAKMVEEAEQFIVSKFGYTSPAVDPAKPKFGPLVVNMNGKLPIDQDPTRQAVYQSGLEEARQDRNPLRRLLTTKSAAGASPDDDAKPAARKRRSRTTAAAADSAGASSAGTKKAARKARKAERAAAAPAADTAVKRRSGTLDPAIKKVRRAERRARRAAARGSVGEPGGSAK